MADVKPQDFEQPIQNPQQIPPKNDLGDAEKTSKVISVSFDSDVLIDESGLSGFVEFTGGGSRKISAPNTNASARMGSARGKANDLSIGAIRMGDRENSINVNTASKSTAFDIPETKSQLPDEEMLGRAVIEKTSIKEAQQTIVNGVSGTDPNRGAPMREFTRNILVHPNGANIKVPRTFQRAQSAWKLVPKVQSNPSTIAGCNAYGVSSFDEILKSDGTSARAEIPEGDYVATALKMTLTATKATLEVIDEQNLEVKPTASQYRLMNDVRTQVHNRSIAIMDAITAETSPTRYNGGEGEKKKPYSPLNITEPKDKWKVRNFDRMMRWLNECGIAVFLAYLSTSVFHSHAKFNLTRDGQRERTISTEWTASDILSAQSSDVFSTEKYESIKDRFDTAWAAIGSAFHTLLMNDSDKKFIQHHSKTSFFDWGKGFLYQFIQPEGLESLSSIVMDKEVVDSILHEYYYTYERQEDNTTLYVTDQISMSFSDSISGALRPLKPKQVVASDGSMPGVHFAATGFASSSLTEFTRDFITIPYLDGANIRKCEVVEHFLWGAIQDYLEDKGPEYFQQLASHEREMAGTKPTEFEVLVPLYFSSSNASLFATLIANSVDYIARRIKRVRSLLADTLKPFDNDWPMMKSSGISVDEGEGKNSRDIAGWVHFYQAMETNPIHFSKVEAHKSVLFGAYTPGEFDVEGKSFLKWHMPDQITMLARTKLSDVNNLNESTSVDVIEMPRGVGSLDYAWETLDVNDPTRPTGINDVIAAFPWLGQKFFKADTDVTRISVPYRNALALSNRTAMLSKITARAMFHRIRMLDPHIEIGDEVTGEEVFIGKPASLTYNAAGPGRTLIMGKDLHSKFTLKWFLERPKNHGCITVLPISMHFPSIPSTVGGKSPWAETKIEGSTRKAIVKYSPFSESILGCSGISLKVWKKAVSPVIGDSSTAFKYATLPATELLIGFWEKYECNSSFSKVLGIPYCGNQISPIVDAVNATMAHAAGDASFKQEFATAYSDGTFDKSDNGLIYFRKPFDSKASTASREGLPSWIDPGATEYLDQYILDDMLGVWARAVVQREMNDLINKGLFGCSSFDPDSQLYREGIGGWVPYDLSAFADTRADCIIKLGKNYVRRITVSDVSSRMDKVAKTEENAEVVVAEAKKD